MWVPPAAVDSASVILHEAAGSIGVGGLWMHGFCDCAQNDNLSVTLRKRSEVAGSMWVPPAAVDSASVILHEAAGSIGVGGLWMHGFCDCAQNDLET